MNKEYDFKVRAVNDYNKYVDADDVHSQGFNSSPIIANLAKIHCSVQPPCAASTCRNNYT